MDGQRANLSSSAPPCCTGIKDARVVLLGDLATKVRVDESDPVFAFATGNSHTRVIDLGDPEKRPLLVTLRPARQGLSVGAVPVFFPAATFFDMQWKQVGESLSLTTRDGDPKVELNTAVPREARYLALHTPYKMIGAEVQVRFDGPGSSQTYMISGAAVTVPGGPSTARAVGMSVGVIEVIPRFR